MDTFRQAVILPSAARTATGQGTAISGLREFSAMTLFLDVTAASSTGSDTIDICLQRLLPDNSTWDTIARFTQILGNGGAVQYTLDLIALAESDRAADTSTSSPTLAAASTRNVPWGDQVRPIWIESGTGSFTFSLFANLRR